MSRYPGCSSWGWDVTTLCEARLRLADWDVADELVGWTETGRAPCWREGPGWAASGTCGLRKGSMEEEWGEMSAIWRRRTRTKLNVRCEKR